VKKWRDLAFFHCRFPLLALLLCGQFPFAVFSLNQNVIRVVKHTFLYHAQPVIVQSIVHETVAQGFQQPQTSFCLQSAEYVPPGDQLFFREEIESLQVLKIAPVLLESAIQVGNGSIGPGDWIPQSEAARIRGGCSGHFTLGQKGSVQNS
jgi:hypothetical protein